METQSKGEPFQPIRGENHTLLPADCALCAGRCEGPDQQAGRASEGAPDRSREVCCPDPAAPGGPEGLQGG